MDSPETNLPPEPSGFLAIQAAMLRECGFRWGCPSYLTGNAVLTEGDISRVITVGTPFTRPSRTPPDDAAPDHIVGG